MTGTCKDTRSIFSWIAWSLNVFTVISPISRRTKSLNRKKGIIIKIYLSIEYNWGASIMAIKVVKFLNRGTKLKDFCLRFSILKGNYWKLRIGLMGSCQKMPKFDFRSQFSMSRIIQIFLNFCFIEGCQFRSTVFVTDIFW